MTSGEINVEPGLLEELKAILRRDLKLGSSAQIEDDMPLVGGDLDLDSLDILLVVSSVEKHFGIKIPNEVVGRWVFQNVTTLARFVQENRHTLSAAHPTVASAARDAVDWIARLPHGPEFRFVSDIHDVVPGERAAGTWKLDGSEPFFRAHFPGRPIVPGVLLIEAMAQVAGIASAGSPEAGRAARLPGSDGGGMLTHADVRFEKPLSPPVSLELRATVVRTIDALRLCEVTASVGGQPVARGTLSIAHGHEGGRRT